MSQVVQRLRKSFLRGVTRPIAWRTQQLEALKKFAFENQKVIVEYIISFF